MAQGIATLGFFKGVRSRLSKTGSWFSELLFSKSPWKQGVGVVVVGIVVVLTIIGMRAKGMQ